ncbi:MAG: hypothetical protein ABSA33_07395, partial [Candidatus Micrarchaeaceae archaeon]
SPLLKAYCARFAIPFQTLPALTMYYLLRVLLMDWQAGNMDLAKYSFRQIKANIESTGNPVF